MFITYALSIGCAVALLGLFLEWAGHRNWPTRRKMWGSLILTVGALGLAPITTHLTGPLPVAAACACLTLALSLKGYHQPVAYEGQALSADQPLTAHQASNLLEAEIVAEATVEEEIVAAEATVEEEIVAAEVAVEEEVVVAEVAVEEEMVVTEVTIEEEIIVAEATVEEEAIADEAVIAAEVVAEAVAVDTEIIANEPAPAALTEEMAAWLNLQISSGYEAKSKGLWAQAVTAFDAAVAVCVDPELKGMLEEELQDCLAQLPDSMKAKLLQAS